MESKMIVQFSGPAAAFLQYDVMNAPGDQEGFLLGGVTVTVTDSISDSQAHCEKTEMIIKIVSHLPCVRPFAFYNGRGEVNESELKGILGKRCKDLLGYYRFRRNSTLQPFLRETVVYRNLQRMLPKARGEFFVLALMTATATTLSTLTLDIRFFRFLPELESLQSTIECLPSSPHSSYRSVSSFDIEMRRKLLGAQLDSIDDDRSNAADSPVHQIDQLSCAIQNELQEVSMKVTASEVQMLNLQAEIRHLKMQLIGNRPMGDNGGTL